jgi:urease accessory protein
VLADDAYRVDVTAAAGAAVRVAASSATKVYACRGGESSLTVSLTVEPGGLLVWGPHTTIVQTGAAYRQQTAVEVAAGGQAVLGEVLVMGRLARGERSGFKRIESRLDVTFEGAPVYSEAYCLSPGPDLIASMAGQGALASVYLLGSDDSTETRIDEALRHERLAGWSQLPNGAGLVVRGLCSSLSQAQCLVERILGVVRAGGAPGGVQEHV